jgi:hypothetical protein
MAIQAHGGEKNLAKLKAESWKIKGRIYEGDEVMFFTCEWFVQPPHRLRENLELVVDGKPARFVRVIDGDKGWLRVDDQVGELEKGEFAENKQELFAHWITTLLPLRDPAFQLAPLGESVVEGRPAVGVRVSHKDYRDVNLFFDRDKGLLLKEEMRGKGQTGKEAVQETCFFDYREIDGVQSPRRFVGKRDGKTYIDGEVSDYSPRDKFDDMEFAKP